MKLFSIRDKLTFELGTELGLGTELETDFGILVIFFLEIVFFTTFFGINFSFPNSN